MGLAKMYSTVENKIGMVFAKYGCFIARHPVKVIILVIVINGGLGIGMIKLKQETTTDDLYVPLGTPARKDKMWLETVFPDPTGPNISQIQRTAFGLWAHVVVKNKTGNLLSRTVLENIGRLDAYVKSVRAKYNDDHVDYSDVCKEYYGRCYVDGEIVFDPDFLNAVDNHSVTYPEFNSKTSGRHNYASILGGTIKTDPTGSYLQAVEYIWLGYDLRSDKTINRAMVTSWMDEFIKQMENFSSDYFELAYAHTNSLDEELTETITGDITLFAVTIAFMIVYASMATMSARCDNVGQRMMLGFAGVLAAGLSIVASFGFCSAIGVSFVSIVGLVPFLLIGIGIDNMFILLSGLSGAQNRKTVDYKLGETLRTSGVAITITSLTDFLAFMAGAISDFVGVKNFCIYTGVAVLFCYFNNITMFTACMAINEKRVDDNRHFLTCRKIKSKEALKVEGNPKHYVFCCGGTPPSCREESESYLDKFPRWLLPKIVLKTPLKITILFIFAGYLAAAIYGCVNLREGLRFKQLAAEDSYYYKYATWTEDHFKRQIFVSFVIDSTYTYSDPAVQAQVEETLSVAKQDTNFVDGFEVSWLATFKNSRYYDNSSESNFIAALRLFFNDVRFRKFENDVVIDSHKNEITASRVYVLSEDMKDTRAEGRLMLRSREISSAASINCFTYSVWFFYYEQYVAVLPQSIQSVSIALAAVFVVTCFFMPHPLLIFYVTVAVLMIMVGVFGFLYYVDVSLSAITMINLIMSIGFSVDFAAHICHGFMTSRGETRHDRVRDTIDMSGAPIFHGFMSSILALVVLAFANSYIFRTFAKVMALVLVFGITHALFLLTVILSWLGPAKLNSVEQASKSGSLDKPSQPELHLNVIANGHVMSLTNKSNGTHTHSVEEKISSETGRRPNSARNLHRTTYNGLENICDIFIAEKGFYNSATASTIPH